AVSSEGASCGDGGASATSNPAAAVSNTVTTPNASGSSQGCSTSSDAVRTVSPDSNTTTSPLNIQNVMTSGGVIVTSGVTSGAAIATETQVVNASNGSQANLTSAEPNDGPVAGGPGQPGGGADWPLVVTIEPDLSGSW